MPLIDEPGTILVASGELPRYAEFEDSLVAVKTPPGSKLIRERSADVAANLNRGLRRRIGSWVWLLGDDHAFEPDCLMRLLARNVDMVAPLVYRKTIPPRSVAYRYGHIEPLEEIPIDDLPPPTQGLIPVSAIGGAGLLVRSCVFDTLRDPWFEVGKAQSDVMCEDLYFVDKAVHAGFSCYLDLETVMGHTGPATLYPIWKDGKWTVKVSMGSRGSATLNPQPNENRRLIEVATSLDMHVIRGRKGA